MKFSCGECQAKYQIPDERVAGRKLKIRCRKCGAAISLRGDPTVEGIAGLPVASAPAVEWHVSIEGDQHGPYSSEQMAGMLRGSQLDWEAHVWREGYGDWKTADASDTLVRAVASLGSAGGGSGEMPAHSGIAPYDDDDVPTRLKPAPEHDEQPTRMAVNASPLVAQGQVFESPQTLDPHAHSPQPLQPQARSAFAHRAASVRAYGSAPPHVYASAAPAVSDTATTFRGAQPPAIPANVRQLPVARSPRVSAAQAMTAERNEDSVLFSANNLVPQSAQQPAQRGGYASGEGSGLIDIRALAALAHSHRSTMTQAPAPSPVTAYPVRAEEPLPAIVHQAGTFSNIDSLRPFERPVVRSSNAVPIAILAGAAMIAVAAFLAVYLTQQPTVATTPAVEAPAVAAAAEQTGDTLPTAAEAPTAVPAAQEPEQLAAVAPQAPEAAAAEEEEEPARETSTRKGGKVRASLARGNRAGKQPAEPKAAKEPKVEKTERAGAVAAKTSEPAPAAAPAEKEKASIDDLLLDDAKGSKPEAVAAPEPAKPKAPSSPRDLDSLMNGAVPAKGGAAAAAPAAAAGDGSLPETPSRDDVQSAMKSVSADVKACAEGQTLTDPTATVALTVIGATGRVQSVRVTGNQGAVGTCIARAVRGASFPKFSKVQLVINYPFKLK